MLLVCIVQISAQSQTTWCSAFDTGKIINIGEPNTTTDASSLSSTNFTSGTKIYIQGTLNIDVNTSFEGCLVQMGTGASITVSAALHIGNSIFFSCQNMWAGIIVVSSSSVEVSSSQFEDALVCFNISALGTYKFTDNTFNRNRVGIQSNVPFAPSPFAGNTFSCTSALKTPWAGTFSRSGMEVNSTAILGVPDQTANTFTGLQCGLFAQNSAVTLYRANFAGMFTGAENFGGLLGGSGIIAIGCNLRVNEFLTPYNINTACQFENNQVAGITSRGTVQLYHNCLFRGNRFGIDSRANTNGQPLTLEHSEFLNLGLPFHSTVFGVYHERSNAVSDQSPDIIVRNRFVTSAIASAVITRAIHVVGTATIGKSFIENNKFENFSSVMMRFISILPNQADNFRINRNRMIFHSVATTSSRYGIELDGGSGFSHTASYNTVTSDDQVMDGHTYTCGLHVDQSPNFRMCVDSTDWGLRGFHFPTNSNWTDLRENIIGHHQYGLQLGIIGQIGSQVRTSNQWSTDGGAYGVWAAFNQNSAWQQSIFIVQSSDPEILPTLRSPAGWFFPQEGTPNGCAEPFTDIELDSFDRIVAAGNQLASSEAEAWDSERRVYLKLLRFPDLSEEPEVDGFYAQIDSTSAGQYAKVDFELWKAILTTESNQETLDDFRLQISIKSDSITVLDSLLEISFDTAAFSKKDRLVQEIDSLMYEVIQIGEQAQEDRTAMLDSVALMAQSLPQITVYELARSDYYKMVIKKWQALDFDSTDLELIRVLSQISDSLAGVTVLDARTLLPPGDSLWTELIDPSCADEEEERHAGSRINHDEFPVLVNLHPNPANERVILQLSKPISGHILLFDTYGRLKIKRMFANSSVVSLETAGLNTGIYNCLLYFEDGTFSPHQIIISK